jgi:acetyl/propionyl-CoA carboxylase alpha subunit
MDRGCIADGKHGRKIEMSAGQSVTEDSVTMILEAMKMEPPDSPRRRPSRRDPGE